MSNLIDNRLSRLEERLKELESKPPEPLDLSPNWKRLLNEHLQVRLWGAFAAITAVLGAGGWFVLNTAARDEARDAAISVTEPEIVKRLVSDDSFLEGVGDRLVESFEGAVMAFQAEKCPEGWSDFEKGHGKFLLGAGRGAIVRPDGGEIRLETRNLDSEGGAERASLTKNHLPRHTHRISTESTTDNVAFHDGLAGSTAAAFGIAEVFTSTTGPGRYGPLDGVLEETGVASPSLEIMPPFVVVTLCIRTAAKSGALP